MLGSRWYLRPPQNMYAMCTKLFVRSFPNVAFEIVSVSDWRLPVLILSRNILVRSSTLHAPLLQPINGVMSLALYPQVVSQAPQHFRSSEMQAICEGSFVLRFVCSLSLYIYIWHIEDNASKWAFKSGCCTLTHGCPGCPFHSFVCAWFQWFCPIPLFSFCSKGIESSRMRDCVRCLWQLHGSPGAWF